MSRHLKAINQATKPLDNMGCHPSLATMERIKENRCLPGLPCPRCGTQHPLALLVTVCSPASMAEFCITSYNFIGTYIDLCKNLKVSKKRREGGREKE